MRLCKRIRVRKRSGIGETSSLSSGENSSESKLALKTLFLVNSAPFPTTTGSALRSWQHINFLARLGPVYLVSFGSREPGDYHVPIVADWTHIDGDSARRPRFLEKILSPLRSRQYPGPGAATAAYNDIVEAMRVRIRPDIIVLSRWTTALPSAIEDHPYVLDMHNIESIQRRDYRSFTSNPVGRLKLWRWRRRERDLVRKAARAWVCSTIDAEALKLLGGRLPEPAIVPNGIDVGYYAHCADVDAPLPPGLHRNGATMIYVGAFATEPNREAAEELIIIFAQVTRKVPHARLLLVGAEPSEAMLEASRKDSRIIVTGRVEDVRPYLALADVSVIALRKGGGTRLKILESFAARVAVVSTRKGAEGLDAIDGRDLLLADSPVDLARITIDLLLDSPRRLTLAANAFDFISRTYSWSALASGFESALPK
jgi:glycosyltransferase involved in cell wall biosynthesis